MLRCFSWQFAARVGGGTPSLDSGQGLSMLPRSRRSGSRLGNHCYFCLLEFPAMYSPQPTSELESQQCCSIDIHISLAAVCNYELHLGLWLSVYRHSVGSLKSMCLDELAMSGAINYCLCRWHFACGLMSSKQGYH